MPTTLQLNEKLPNYFYFSDGNEDLTDIYESNKLIIIDNFKLDYNRELFRKANPVNDEKMNVKKSKGKLLFLPIVPERYKEHIISRYFPDIKRGKSFQKNIFSIHKQMRAFVARCFPKYKIELDNDLSYRFVLCRNEPMHFDSYAGQNNSYHNLRMFFNCDLEPRIWNTGQSIDLYYNEYKEIFQSYKKYHPNEINKLVDKEIQHYFPQKPYHKICFQPGTLWLVNSQAVAHQIEYGNKMIAYSFKINEKTMNNINRNFYKQVENLYAS